MKTCPSCGYTTDNDQAKFRKKCGTQFVVTNSVSSDIIEKESKDDNTDGIKDKETELIFPKNPSE